MTSSASVFPEGSSLQQFVSPFSRIVASPHEGTNTIPSETMTWVVPYAPDAINLSVVYDPASPFGDYLTEDAMYEILNVSWPGQWRVEGRYLQWG